MATSVHEIKIKSSGFPGAPGWTTFYFDGSVPANSAAQFDLVDEFLVNVTGLFPTQWSAVIQPQGRILNASSGILESFSQGPAAIDTPHIGVGVGGFGAGVAGLVLGWSTAGVNRGHAVRGRTFMVPLANGYYDVDGTLDNDSLGDLRTFVNTWSTQFDGIGVWSRPRLGTGGAWFKVTGSHVNDQAAFLSSRRT